ncbi:MAG: GNAT family N-acetyltransferase [Alphaproteobacteria bacterium]|nr:GNAT family N-acetyltransferase [Alphaproteobacteria bacterium]
MSKIEIIPFTRDHKEAVLDLAIEAWTPVFARTKNDVPKFVYDAFYPNGWSERQRNDVAELFAKEPDNIWLAVIGNELAGFLGLRIHPEDQMGEIHIIAVSPQHQRHGIARQLMAFAEERTRALGMKMMMVETIGDSGHEPARRTYESLGFQRWPVARYFKQL